jgi:hypothetical protein
MSDHVWKVQRMSRDTIQRGMFAYRLARTESDSKPLRLDYLPALCFAGYVMETIRQQGGEPQCRMREVGWPAWICRIWNGTVRSHHRYARGRNRDNYELAGRKMLAAAIRLTYGHIHGGPEEQLGGLLLKLEETGDALPVLRDYLEEHRYEECLLILEGSFRGYTYAKTKPRSEDDPKEVQPDSVPTTAYLDLDLDPDWH